MKASRLRRDVTSETSIFDTVATPNSQFSSDFRENHCSGKPTRGCARTLKAALNEQACSVDFAQSVFGVRCVFVSFHFLIVTRLCLDITNSSSDSAIFC